MNKEDRRLFEEKISTLVPLSKTNLLANFAAGNLMAWLTVAEPITRLQLAWLITFNAVHVYHFLARGKLLTASSEAKLRHFCVSSFILGLLWAGYLVAFAGSETGDHAIYLSSVLIAGVIAASLTSTSLYLRLYYLFSLPAILAFFAMLTLASDVEHLALGGLMLIFYAMCSHVAGVLNQRLTESFKLRFENLDVLEELRKQKASAERANQSKSRFLAAASHDLRQPLHALAYFLEAQRLSMDDDPPYADKIESTLQSLESLFDGLLDISQLEGGGIEVHPVHFGCSELINKVVSMHDEQARRKGLTILAEQLDFTAYSDPRLVERIIGNIVSNAIRYTDVGAVSIRIAETNDSHLVLTVSDTGRGISDQEIEHIFDEFYQVRQASTDQRQGLGLGLSIVKHLGELLDLKVLVKSEIERGTHFSVVLPKGDAKLVETAEPKLSVQPTELEGKNILLVEDEAEVREATRVALERWGCQVVACESGQQAKLCITEQNLKIDFVIADLQLKEHENGVVVIQAIRDQLQRPNLPALVISGDTATETLQQITQAGLRLLGKPVRPAELRLHLLRQLAKKRA